jgi:hypothetical protein
VLAARESLEIDAVTLVADEYLEAAVHEPLGVHSGTDSRLVEQGYADLLEDPGSDTAAHVIARMTLEQHGVDAALVQQLPEQETGWAAADDDDLRSHVS